ncbi:HAD-like domain-containing protein [Pavlovales sp. CCMP2436]|nr:HAD-like domain-containing protein [Pavlovales sp. CCMP2436]|mmetsp:Transcript_41020/g.101225  ORF Transcript_41020/g.101225 Transcript_41020/m.101225 type:complete len:334 (+) Transcript_41020:21-1022(+)
MPTSRTTVFFAVVAAGGVSAALALVRRKRRLVTLQLFGSAAQLCHAGAAAKVRDVGGGGHAGLHAVVDFDLTLTAHDSSQCHDSLQLLPPPHAALNIEMARYLDFSDGGHPGLVGAPLSAWWDRVHALLRRDGITRNDLAHAQGAARFALRPGAAEALHEMRRLGVPCTIVSAGLEHIILDLLHHMGFHDAISAAHCDGSHDARIRVLANRLEFASDGKCVGCWPDPHVTSGNKRELTYTLLRAHFDASPDAARRRLIVVGDSCGDALVAGLVPHALALAVGYYNPTRAWRTRPDFEKAFDVLLPHTDSLAWLATLLRDLERGGPGDRAPSAE